MVREIFIFDFQISIGTNEHKKHIMYYLKIRLILNSV